MLFQLHLKRYCLLLSPYSLDAIYKTFRTVNAGLKLHHWPERKYISLGALGLSMVPHGGVLLYSDGGVRGCGQTGFWCLCLGFARLTAVFEAKALAVHFQNVDMVG